MSWRLTIGLLAVLVGIVSVACGQRQPGAAADPYAFITCRTECLRKQSVCAIICNKLCTIFQRDGVDSEECQGLVEHCHRCWDHCQKDLLRCFVKCYPEDQADHHADLPEL
ncbi:Uncharacterized protein PBTT_08398 [Plasmodiophora brassicae]|uniref:Uncharacterized protein n=1 Tax=Plasmodiophora brassicae TaxID=37360 RepID=A0A3P3YJ12_PLABS|nr:unnamed protein product [Plasmodiophora brassicae]